MLKMARFQKALRTAILEIRAHQNGDVWFG